MADRIVESSETEVPEIPEVLESVMIFALEEAREKMNQGADLVPFTALVVKDNLFLETHPGDSAEACFASAKHTVEGARGADAYAFCYDGYIETDAGTKDAIIAEGGIPGEPEGMAIGYLYRIVDDKPVFENEPAFIGEAPNFMSALKDSEEYEEVEQRYLEDDSDEEPEPDEE